MESYREIFVFTHSSHVTVCEWFGNTFLKLKPLFSRKTIRDLRLVTYTC